MSNAEHLIENALCSIEKYTKAQTDEVDVAIVDWDLAWQDFDIPMNRKMAKTVGVPMLDVWDMAFTAWAWTQDKLYEEYNRWKD